MSVITDIAMRFEVQYRDLLLDLKYKLDAGLMNGTVRKDRTGVGTASIFGAQVYANLQTEFPILTGKKIHTKSVIYELLWFLRGETNNNWLEDRGVTIWREWANENGSLGPIYGKQMRGWVGEDSIPHDQLITLVNGLRKDPYSRRHVVSCWNVADLKYMALAPCHCLFQCYVEDGYLDLQLYQRSADLFLGVPFNIVSYSILTYILAAMTNLTPRNVIITFGDVHLYSNHADAVDVYVNREIKDSAKFKLVGVTPDTRFEDLSFEMFSITDYDHYPAISAAVAI